MQHYCYGLSDETQEEITLIQQVSIFTENKKGVIFLLDSEKDIRKKIMSATTDSEMVVRYDKDNKPGISNLISIYSALKNISIKEVEELFKDSNYGNFKKCVADVVVEELTKIQNKYNEIINSDIIDKILDENIDKVRSIAKEKYDLVKKRISIGR